MAADARCAVAARLQAPALRDGIVTIAPGNSRVIVAPSQHPHCTAELQPQGGGKHALNRMLFAASQTFSINGAPQIGLIKKRQFLNEMKKPLCPCGMVLQTLNVAVARLLCCEVICEKIDVGETGKGTIR